MEANPYAAPEAAVEDVGSFEPGDLESQKAGRGKRLGASLIDTFLMCLWIVPAVMTVRYGTQGWLVLAGGVALLQVVINCLLLHHNGQTIGKLALKIKVVRTDGSRIGLGRIILLRFLPIGLLGAIPVVGRFVGLVDSLMIFGTERRCLHDQIADTIVIDC